MRSALTRSVPELEININPCRNCENFCSLFPTPCSLFPVPCSLFPVPFGKYLLGFTVQQ
ncbi:MAG: hypothetical protein F6J90_30755 [Moorea sp. SIOASIH]|uniref:hypothetical protein n=1 Tax=Moorena sp. SIOASIH TaxID=2607817 RepID=UPI0013B6AF22|nr:hypothetical protein [Moorena sp. SIOASIH]NEO40484.1 hypothetical protein [Moorena sp. SIOASIH]